MSDVSTGSEELLKKEILADAQRKAKRILTKAERAAAKTLETAKREAERIVSLARSQAEMRARRETASARASLEAELRRMDLSARERLIRQVFDRAVEKLAALDEGRRRGMLEALTSAALTVLEGDRFVAVVAPSDAPLIDDAFLADVRRRIGRDVDVRVETDGKILGGIKLASDDGRLLCDNTVRARLERLAPQLRLAVADILFAEGKEND